MLELESPFFVFSLGKMILVMLLGFVPLNDAFNHLNLRMKAKGTCISTGFHNFIVEFSYSLIHKNTSTRSPLQGLCGTSSFVISSLCNKVCIYIYYRNSNLVFRGPWPHRSQYLSPYRQCTLSPSTLTRDLKLSRRRAGGVQKGDPLPLVWKCCSRRVFRRGRSFLQHRIQGLLNIICKSLGCLSIPFFAAGKNNDILQPASQCWYFCLQHLQRQGIKSLS